MTTGRFHFPAIGSLLFLAITFYTMVLSKDILSPLMPIIEDDLGIGHRQAGSLFFVMALGHFGMLLASGFVAFRFSRTMMIALSSIGVGLSLLFVSFAQTLSGIRLGLLLLGMASGLYLPAAIAILTTAVHAKDLGKAIAIHELAPSLATISAPLIAVALLGSISWRELLLLISAASIVAGLAFITFDKSGRFREEASTGATLRHLLLEPSFWIMVILFSLAIGGEIGVYSMLPLYLVKEKGRPEEWANTLVALSRIPGLGMIVLSGIAADWLGPKKAMRIILLACGILTAWLGMARESLIIPLIFLQATMSVGVFPPAIAIVSRIGPSRSKSTTISLTVATAILLGAGAVPAAIGHIGEIRSLALGMILLGGLIVGGVGLLQFVKIPTAYAE